ncbi:Sec-independent protein translocase protein TatB [Gordonia sp. CPCC 206044]|uniref:Sec-independent protein translocase protein TatB n=1 Tax=Gordonia sp. CPCC 206044 TaxID=3140793 RepID=UPI003AF3B0D0
MFSSIGWGEIVILLAAGLIILGPERLPDAVSWTMKSLRQVRDYATGATNQLKDELGPEFDDLRKPLSELNELRGMTPRAVVTRHLLDGDDSIFRMGLDSRDVDRPTTPTPEIKPVSAPLPPEPGTEPAGRTADDTAPRRRSVSDWDAT